MLYILGCLRTHKIWKFLFIIPVPYFTSFLLYHNYRIKGNRVQGIFKVLGHGQHRAEPIIVMAKAITTMETEQTGTRTKPEIATTNRERTVQAWVTRVVAIPTSTSGSGR